jgi:pimeloyl-ACP methyl ester carboxylesterase
MDPGVAAWWLRSKFAALTGDDRIICVSLGTCASLAACREKIVKAVERAFPGDSTFQTTEVDVVGYSLGGLAARYAADSSDPVKRLAIHRLFAISSPLRGAKVAERLPLLHPVQADVRPGSALLTQLNSHEPAYPVYAYIRLGDSTIGEANAALPGQTAWWVDVAPLSDAHNGAFYDPRFIADIARRLRNEPAYSQSPPALLPQPVSQHG